MFVSLTYGHIDIFATYVCQYVTHFFLVFIYKAKYMVCSVLQCVAVCCSVLQCVAVRCSVLQCVCRCVYLQSTFQEKAPPCC